MSAIDVEMILGWKSRAVPGLRCHWCGRECSVELVPSGEGRYVRCLSWHCCASGPVKRKKVDAIEAWKKVGPKEGDA